MELWVKAVINDATQYKMCVFPAKTISITNCQHFSEKCILWCLYMENITDKYSLYCLNLKTGSETWLLFEGECLKLVFFFARVI